MSKEQQMSKQFDVSKETDFPLYLYHHGKNDRIYEIFGAHKQTENGEEGYMFRVWAPHAKSVSVVGDFNGWNTEANVMQRMVDGRRSNCSSPVSNSTTSINTALRRRTAGN